MEPDIYRDIVTHPDPSADIFYLGLLRSALEGEYKHNYGIDVWQGRTYLKDLLSPENFQRRIPALVKYEPDSWTWYAGYGLGGYGMALKRTISQMNQQMERYYIGGSTRWLGPGGGDIVTPSTEHWRPTGNLVRVYSTEAMSIEVIRSKEPGNYYDLSFYSHVVGEMNDYPIIILANESPNVLKQIVGDQVIKRLNR